MQIKAWACGSKIKSQQGRHGLQLAARSVMNVQGTLLRAGESRLLNAVAAAELAKIERHLTRIDLRQFQILHEAGEPIRQVYFPYSGMISIVAVMRDGHSVETTTIGRHGGLGLLAGFSPRCAVGRAIVQLPGQAAQISATHWHEIVQDSPVLQKIILHQNDLQMVRTQQTVACNALHDIEARLCRWLLEARDHAGADILPLTQEFLGDMLAVRRTTVTLIARTLQSAGLIRYRRGAIAILDAAGLEEAACECYQTLRQTKDDALAH